MRGAVGVAIALAVGAALPATAVARESSVYKMAEAAGSVRVSFAGESATCARFGTCGASGKITYEFGRKPRGRLILATDRRRRASGGALFRTSGTTVATMTQGASCTDTVRHRTDLFTLGSTPKLKRLLFTLHGGSPKTDWLETDCAGPTEAMLARDDALPQASFKASDFRGPRTAFRLSGSSFFSEQGYRGSVRWKASYRVLRQRCSPHCGVRPRVR